MKEINGTSNAVFGTQMYIRGLNDSIGDRELTFEIQLDPNDLEQANRAWYAHLANLLGCTPEEADKMSTRLAGVQAQTKLNAKGIEIYTEQLKECHGDEGEAAAATVRKLIG